MYGPQLTGTPARWGACALHSRCLRILARSHYHSHASRTNEYTMRPLYKFGRGYARGRPVLSGLRSRSPENTRNGKKILASPSPETPAGKEVPAAPEPAKESFPILEENPAEFVELFLTLRPFFAEATDMRKKKQVLKHLYQCKPMVQPFLDQRGEDGLYQMTRNLLHSGVFWHPEKPRKLFPDLNYPLPPPLSLEKLKEMASASDDAPQKTEEPRRHEQLEEPDELEEPKELEEPEELKEPKELAEPEELEDRSEVDGKNELSDSKADAVMARPSDSLRSDYFPYPTQHTLLSNVQAILEQMSFDFLMKYTPNYVKRQGWTCAEMVPLDKCVSYMETSFTFLEKRAGIEVDWATWSYTLHCFRLLRNNAVHRSQVDVESLRNWVSRASRFALTVGDYARADQLASVLVKLDSAIMELKRGISIINADWRERMTSIESKRAELDRMAAEAEQQMKTKRARQLEMSGDALNHSLRSVFSGGHTVRTYTDRRYMRDRALLLEKERAEQARLENERLERERFESDRLERLRLEAERLEYENTERERLETERRLKKERDEARARKEQEEADYERLERKKLEQRKSFIETEKWSEEQEKKLMRKNARWGRLMEKEQEPSKDKEAEGLEQRRARDESQAEKPKFFGRRKTLDQSSKAEKMTDDHGEVHAGMTAWKDIRIESSGDAGSDVYRTDEDLTAGKKHEEHLELTAEDKPEFPYHGHAEFNTVEMESPKEGFPTHLAEYENPTAERRYGLNLEAGAPKDSHSEEHMVEAARVDNLVDKIDLRSSQLAGETYSRLGRRASQDVSAESTAVMVRTGTFGLLPLVPREMFLSRQSDVVAIDAVIPSGRMEAVVGTGKAGDAAQAALVRDELPDGDSSGEKATEVTVMRANTAPVPSVQNEVAEL
ncbi:hypothetical protein MPH_10246 [Macrophomina phaseolina MS6]|uniref:Uncharacterized protein n=1 Tax=Macrophomina phaseolina (strain MS6) TaxID=1126212 RepID=K2QRU5_MACPH|nr:hypothetical protein MPH_10246 [Macrophomina phaseolina MS6]